MFLHAMGCLQQRACWINSSGDIKHILISITFIYSITVLKELFGTIFIKQHMGQCTPFYIYPYLYVRIYISIRTYIYIYTYVRIVVCSISMYIYVYTSRKMGYLGLTQTLVLMTTAFCHIQFGFQNSILLIFLQIFFNFCVRALMSFLLIILVFFFSVNINPNMFLLVAGVKQQLIENIFCMNMLLS
eukprot:TRINITY_DN793_c1_g1_i1.p3 TRINITY_DN793_c1_g1~~TRINITY_DN793_c1_g1_i1.p3  ORF type:complete len:187 (-),score=-24.22 TRINITY_DN793_c1_g1_i1:819-1379(-)